MFDDATLRAKLMFSYYSIKGNDPAVVRFFDSLFADAKPDIRAAVVRAKGGSERRMTDETVLWLRRTALDDKDEVVRVAALESLGGRASHIQFLCERATSDQSDFVRSVAVRRVGNSGYDNPKWYIDILRNDESVSVKNAVLDWIDVEGASQVGQDELRALLVGIMESEVPGNVAARAGSIALRRWPADPEVRILVENTIDKIPDNMSPWRTVLKSMLLRRGREISNS
jgi:hypothetical protein